MPRVSVIIPAYNAEAFIGEALESVLQQTVRPEEIIVVDDGSTDRTAEIARSFGPPVIVISEHVGGSGPARNLAISRSTGEWLAFLDADDVWLPEKQERQLAAIGPETRLVCSDRINIGDLRGLPVVQGALQPQKNGAGFVEILLGNFINTSTVMLRRDAFYEAGTFPTDDELIVAQDWDLWVRVTYKHPIVALPEPLVKYRLHPGGSSRQLDKMIMGRIGVVHRALHRPKGKALPWATKRRIWAATHLANGNDAAKSGRNPTAWRLLLRSVLAFPLQREAYVSLARLALGRS